MGGKGPAAERMRWQSGKMRSRRVEIIQMGMSNTSTQQMYIKVSYKDVSTGQFEKQQDLTEEMIDDGGSSSRDIHVDRVEQKAIQVDPPKLRYCSQKETHSVFINRGYPRGCRQPHSVISHEAPTGRNSVPTTWLSTGRAGCHRPQRKWSSSQETMLIRSFGLWYKWKRVSKDRQLVEQKVHRCGGMRVLWIKNMTRFAAHGHQK